MHSAVLANHLSTVDALVLDLAGGHQNRYSAHRTEHVFGLLWLLWLLLLLLTRLLLTAHLLLTHLLLAHHLLIRHRWTTESTRVRLELLLLLIELIHITQVRCIEWRLLWPSNQLVIKSTERIEFKRGKDRLQHV